MLKSLEERHYVLQLWPVWTKDFVCRVVPDVSSKPATAHKCIKEYCYAYCADDGEDAAFARPPLPLALPS